MKKLISLALALVLSLSLIACGAKQDDTPQTGADPLPLLLLLVGGCLLVIWGTADILRSRREHDE